MSYLYGDSPVQNQNAKQKTSSIVSELNLNNFKYESINKDEINNYNNNNNNSEVL